MGAIAVIRVDIIVGMIAIVCIVVGLVVIIVGVIGITLGLIDIKSRYNIYIYIVGVIVGMIKKIIVGMICIVGIPLLIG